MSGQVDPYWQMQQQMQGAQQQQPQGQAQGGMWTITGPDGQSYQVPANQMDQGFTPPNQEAMLGQQAGAGLGTGMGAGAGNGLSGMLGSAPQAASMAPPAAPSIASATAYPGSMAAPATPSFAGASAVAPQGSGALGMAGVNPALGAAGIAAGAATGAAQIGGIKNVADSQSMSVPQAAALALPTFGASLLYNPIHSMFSSSKDKGQHSRDGVRKKLVESGFLNPDYTLTLPDGSTFDFGKDGNARLPNEGVDPITGEPWRHYYDVDWSKDEAKNIGGVVAAVNPLAAAFANGDKKLTKDFAGYLANAVTQSGDPIKNIQGVIEKAGMNHDQLYGAIHLMSKSQGGSLDDGTADAYKNGLDQLYGVGAYKGKGSQLGTPTNKAGEAQPASNSVPNPPAGSPQQPTAKSSPFVGSALNARPGRGVRQSPGVYLDPRTGKTFNSKDGELE